MSVSGKTRGASRKQPRKPYPGRCGEHFEDEPSYSLLVRTARYNGVRRIYSLFLRYRANHAAALDAAEIARLCKQDELAVRRASPIVTRPTVKLFDESIKRNQFSVVHRRWCPKCIAENAYHRVWWDLSHVTACPKHGVRLVDRCQCERPLFWRMHALDKCNKGHLFAYAQTSQASADEIAASSYIVDRLMGTNSSPSPLLDSLGTLGAAINAMERIGQASFGEQEGLQILREKFGRGIIAAEGFRVLSQFPAAFEDLLDRLMLSTKGGSRKWGTEHAYGDFYIWITRLSSKTAFGKALKAAVRDHATKKVTLKLGHKVAGLPVTLPDHVDVTTAAKMWDMDRIRFRRVAAIMGLMPKHKIQGQPARLDAKFISEFADTMRSRKTREQIADELGIANHVAGRLASAGVIPAIIDGKTDRDNRVNIWLLPETAASDLLNRLRAAFREDQTLPLSDPGLASIPAASKTARISLINMIRLILEGGLPVRAIDQNAIGLKGFFVLKSEAVLALRRKSVPEPTLTRVAKLLGYHPELLTQLRNRGLLKATKVGIMWSISSDEIERLRSTYATTTELAQQFGLSDGRSIIRILSQMEIEPSCPRPPFHQVLYPRSVSVSALEKWQTEKRAEDKRQLAIPKNWIDCKSAALLMGIDPMLLTQLVDAGIVYAYRKLRGFLVSPETVEAFRRDYITTTELAKLAGKKHGNSIGPVLMDVGVEPLCARPDFYATIFPRRDALATVEERRDLFFSPQPEVAVASREQYMNAREVREAIAVHDCMLAELQEAGLLEGVSRGPERIYLADDVTRFKQTYISGAETDKIIQVPNRRGGGKGVRLMLKLRIEPVCARPTFRSFLFRRAEVNAALQIHRDKEKARADARIANPKVMLRDMRARIGMNSDMAAALVRTGFLAAEIKPGAILVEEAEIERFQRKYIMSAEIARIISKPGAMAGHILMVKLGVQAAAGSDTLPNHLYDRTQVDAAIREWRRNPSIAKPLERRGAGELRASDVGSALKVSDSVVARIVEAGLLPARKAWKTTLVRKEDLKAFQRQYAVENEFIGAFGRYYKGQVTTELMRLGVQRIKLDCSVAIYRRAEVEAALKEKTRSNQRSR
jgi:hypothetical protein